MNRARTLPSISQLLSISLILGLSSLGGTGCKKGEKASGQEETKPTEVAPTEPAEVENQTPVKADVTLIDKALVALADATLAKAAQDGEAGTLPTLNGKTGLSCGTEEDVTAALAHIGFDPTPLKAREGFLFADVCVGWRPYIKPVTEIFWMISAGDIDEGTGLMPHRRCLRVHTSDGGLVKAEITDGLCLALHLKEREAALAAEKAEKEAAAAEKTEAPEKTKAPEKAKAEKAKAPTE